MAPAASAAANAATPSLRLLSNQYQAHVLSAYPIVGIAPTHDSKGYWMVASNGGVFTFGDAHFYGSLGNVALNQPIVGMAATPDGKGYWLVASDGGIFTFGDARFYGSTGNVRLNKPIVGMAATHNGDGYLMVASDGGIFTFGDAHFYGSTGNVNLAEPIVGMASTPNGAGYWLVASDGGVFNFGDAPFHGSAVAFNQALGASSVGILAVEAGYWVPNDMGAVDALGAPGVAGTNPAQTNVLPAGENPSASIGPSSAFVDNCYGGDPNISGCNSAALADVNYARSTEGLGNLSLPSDFYSLSNTSQLVAVANAERTSRGLPAFPENGTLDSLAQQAAGLGQDPEGPSNYTWGSNIAFGAATPLAADFGWMYDDGPNSANVDCQAAGDAGCWGHRDNVLSPWTGAAGAGDFDNNGTVQLTQLFVENY
jgi:ribosomal protein L24E